jgi:hypothetical protein
MAKSTNDKQVLELKKQVQEKKAALSASEVFKPKTNCSLLIDGERTNIRAASSERLVDLLVKVNALRLSAEDLGVANEFKISGFGAQEWISDIKSLLMNINRKQEEQRLKVLEDKLFNLLSSDKKVELEIDELRNQI